VVLVVLVGGDEEVLVAFGAGEVRGPGIGADEEPAAVRDGPHDGLQDVGEDRADDEIGAVALDQLARLVDGDVGLQLVVDHDDLGVHAAELAAHLLHREEETVAGLLAEHRRGAGQGEDQADLHALAALGGGGAAEHGCGQQAQSERAKLLHFFVSPCARGALVCWYGVVARYFTHKISPRKPRSRF
jgi:hypothetical protein